MGISFSVLFCCNNLYYIIIHSFFKEARKTTRQKTLLRKIRRELFVNSDEELALKLLNKFLEFSIGFWSGVTLKNIQIDLNSKRLSY